MPPQRVWFLSLFGLKTGINFGHFGLESGMVFKGTTGYMFQFHMNKKERDICEFETLLRNLFVCVLISNDDIIS